MALNDIFQIRVVQTFVEQSLENVFYFQQSTSGATNADDLLSVFADNLWDLARECQMPEVVTVGYGVINGNNNSDFSIVGASDAGLFGTGEVLAGNIALGFRSPSGGPGSRFSYKRLSGCSTGFISTGNNGKFNHANILSPALALSVALGQVMEGDLASYAPVQLLGGFQLGIAPTVGRALAGQWSYDQYPTHQDTRQVYDWVTLS